MTVTTRSHHEELRDGRVYELQKTYALVQDAALNEVGQAGGTIAGGVRPLVVMERINSRMAAAQQLARGLLRAYDEEAGK